jgi:hypothetical protein
MSKESTSLGLLVKMGGKSHLKLNIGQRPIANKYREGKMKRTLKLLRGNLWKPVILWAILTTFYWRAAVRSVLDLRLLSDI